MQSVFVLRAKKETVLTPLQLNTSEIASIPMDNPIVDEFNSFSVNRNDFVISIDPPIMKKTYNEYLTAWFRRTECFGNVSSTLAAAATTTRVEFSYVTIEAVLRNAYQEIDGTKIGSLLDESQMSTLVNKIASVDIYACLKLILEQKWFRKAALTNMSLILDAVPDDMCVSAAAVQFIEELLAVLFICGNASQLRRFGIFRGVEGATASLTKLKMHANELAEELLLNDMGPASFLCAACTVSEHAKRAAALRQSIASALRDGQCNLTNRGNAIALMAWLSCNEPGRERELMMFGRVFQNCEIDEAAACYDFEAELRRAMKGQAWAGTKSGHTFQWETFFHTESVDSGTHAFVSAMGRSTLAPFFCTYAPPPKDGYAFVSVGVFET